MRRAKRGEKADPVEARRQIQQLRLPTLRNLVLLVPRMIGATFSAAIQVFYLTVEAGWPEPSASGSNGRPRERPEPLVGRIHWRGGVGDTLHHRLRITNRGRQTCMFSIIVEPFLGTDVRLVASHERKAIAAGASVDCLLSLTVPESLAGGRYIADILVTGAATERIEIVLEVDTRQRGVTVVEQGAELAG